MIDRILSHPLNQLVVFDPKDSEKAPRSTFLSVPMKRLDDTLKEMCIKAIIHKRLVYQLMVKYIFPPMCIILL